MSKRHQRYSTDRKRQIAKATRNIEKTALPMECDH